MSATWSNLITDWIKETAQKTNNENGQTSRAFDFVLKGIFNDVFGCGNSSSNVAGKGSANYALLNDANIICRRLPGYAVTFVDNHDTGSTQRQWYINPDGIAPAYAYILTHPGYPSVAWYHYFDGESKRRDTDTGGRSWLKALTSCHVRVDLGLKQGLGVSRLASLGRHCFIKRSGVTVREDHCFPGLLSWVHRALLLLDGMALQSGRPSRFVKPIVRSKPIFEKRIKTKKGEISRPFVYKSCQIAVFSCVEAWFSFSLSTFIELQCGGVRNASFASSSRTDITLTPIILTSMSAKPM